MSEDEKKETQDEIAEETSAEGSEAPAAGPDAASEEPAGGGDASVLDSSESAPPAGEGSDAQDEAPAEEPTPDSGEEAEESAAPAEEPAAEAKDEEAEPDPEDELPWKEKRRLERSRRPHKAGSQRSPEERKAERVAARARKAEERRKERAAARGKKTVGTGTPAAEKDANAAKVRQGIVVSDKGQKSITVRVDIVRRHPTYEKVIRRSRTLHAHDERNEAGEGDVVRVVETRPLSKTKRWRLVEVLEKAK
jgi:small subunit ribosomal protein S17